MSTLCNQILLFIMHVLFHQPSYIRIASHIMYVATLTVTLSTYRCIQYNHSVVDHCENNPWHGNYLTF